MKPKLPWKCRLNSDWKWRIFAFLFIFLIFLIGSIERCVEIRFSTQRNHSTTAFNFFDQCVMTHIFKDVEYTNRYALFIYGRKLNSALTVHCFFRFFFCFVATSNENKKRALSSVVEMVGIQNYVRIPVLAGNWLSMYTVHTWTISLTTHKNTSSRPRNRIPERKKKRNETKRKKERRINNAKCPMSIARQLKSEKRTKQNRKELK